MSGTLRLLAPETPLRPHDHVDIMLNNRRVLRFNDPRRFGCLLWQEDGQIHPLLQRLGCEPLSDSFNGDYLYQCSRARNVSVKTFLMDQRIVVGVGNIYAAESLFRAGISPLCEADKISLQRYRRLAEVVKDILLYAINREELPCGISSVPMDAPVTSSRNCLSTVVSNSPVSSVEASCVKPPSDSELLSGAATAKVEASTFHRCIHACFHQVAMIIAGCRR